MDRPRATSPAHSRTIILMVVTALIAVFVGGAVPSASGRPGAAVPKAVPRVGTLNAPKAHSVMLQDLPQATGHEKQKPNRGTLRQDGTSSDEWKGSSAPDGKKPA